MSSDVSYLGNGHKDVRGVSDRYKRSTDEEIGTSMEQLNSLQVVTKHQHQVHHGGNSFNTITGSPTAIPTVSQTATPSEESTGSIQETIAPPAEAFLRPIIQTEPQPVIVSREPTQQTETPSTSIPTKANQQMKKEIVTVNRAKSLVHAPMSRPRITTYRTSNHYMLEPGVILPHSGPSTVIIKSPILFPTPQFSRTEGEDVTFTSQGT